MRLYTNKDGQWFGTQADARKGAPRNWVEVDVPTSKQDLINWLNANQVGGGYDKPVDTVVVAPYDPDAPAGSYEPELESSDDVKLIKSAQSWVAWALDNLERGDTKSAKEMLKKGLKAQKGVA
jgi:hypothetical protein